MNKAFRFVAMVKLRLLLKYSSLFPNSADPVMVLLITIVGRIGSLRRN